MSLAKRIHDGHAGELGENAVDATTSRVSEILERPRPEPRQHIPMDKDSPMLQPIENWEASDKRPPGEKLFFYPTKKWRENYERIDWTKV
jgi:hypothetical protein